MALAAALLVLNACGFHLRGVRPLPFATIYLGANPDYSPLFGELRREIEATGKTRVVSNPAEAEVRVELTNFNRDMEILSLSATGQVQEYRIELTIHFRVVDQGGKVLVEPKTLSAYRDYYYNDALVLAKEQEAEMLFRDMERDLMFQILRRVSALADESP